MSKANVVLLLAAVVAVGAGVFSGRTSVEPARAEDNPRKTEEAVQKWEYKVVEYGYGYKDMKGREKSFTDALNKLGKEGWEFAGPLTNETIIATTVTGFPSSSGSRSFVVFKRPRK